MSKVKKRELEAYHFIKDKIVNKEWPPQKHIREQDVARTLEMSRTPIRNAFIRLEKEQFIIIEPYKGAKILPLKVDSQSIKERIEFLELMVVHYFMKLERAEKQIDLNLSLKRLKKMKQLSSNTENEFEKEEWRLWKELLILETNRYSRALILNSIKDLLPDDGELLEFLYKSRQTKIKHYEQVIYFLEESNYPYARREVRILLNQLLLNIIQSTN